MKNLILLILCLSFNFVFSQNSSNLKIDENTKIFSKETGKETQVDVWNYFQMSKYVFLLVSPNTESKIKVDLQKSTVKFDKGVEIKMSIYQKIDINQYVINFNELHYYGSLIINYQNKKCDLYTNHILTFQ